MLIDLTSNENPYSRDIDINIKEINRYTSRKEMESLISKLADYSGFNKESIIIDYGTNRLIERLILKYHKNRDLYILNPNSYGFIGLAKDVGMKVKRLQLVPPDFTIDWEKQDINNSIIVIDSPNNPTGQFMINEDQLKKLLKNNIVIIDEAGYEYSSFTFGSLIEDNDNLCIIRTLDKAFGLAGLKIGYMTFGNGLSKCFNNNIELNKPTLKALEIALSDTEYLKKTTDKTINIKNQLINNLRDLEIIVYDSYANYLLINTEIADFSLKLRKRGIMIEDLSVSWVKGYYRITIGTKNEIDSLIAAIKEIKK